MTTATGSTAFKSLGDVPYKIWRDTITSAGGPTELASQEAWESVRPHSLLALRMLLAESTYGSNFKANPKSNRNPWNIKWREAYGESKHGANDYVKYASWAEAAYDWKKHITDPPYDKLTSIAQFVHTYAPSYDNNDEEAYVAKIVDGANSLPREGGIPVPDLVYGNVEQPKFTNRDIPNGTNTAWSYVTKRTVRAVVLHRMLGTLWGTDEYFRNEGRNRALTDFGVGVAAQDGAANAGVILRWNDPRGHEAPWSSGPVSAPYGDGKAFVDRYSVNAVNSDTTAIEISGANYNVALDAKSREAISHFIAYWADQYKVPWTNFPLIPNEGNRSFVCWHQEFTIGTGKVCPGDVVIRETPALIERAKAIMKAAQTTDATTPEVKPTLPPMPIQSQIRNQKVFLAYEQELVAVKDSKCWYRAETDAVIIPQLTITKGKKYKTAYAVDSDDTMWFIMADGSRVPASVFVGIVENG